MNWRRPTNWCIASLWLVTIIGLPIVGTWLRRHAEGGCALDGVRIDAVYEVRIIDDREVEHRLCCIQCAVWWLQHHGKRPAKVLVTDERSGRRLSAESAYFVRSGVMTHATTGNRVHVFENQADAKQHAESSRGTILTGSSRPFADLARENTEN